MNDLQILVNKAREDFRHKKSEWKRHKRLSLLIGSTLAPEWTEADQACLVKAQKRVFALMQRLRGLSALSRWPRELGGEG